MFDSQTKQVISKYHVCICAYPTATGAREKFSLQRGITEFDYEKDIYEIYVGEGETFGFDFIADGYLPKHIIVTPVKSKQTDIIRVIDVPLEKAGELAGVVVDAISGSPIHDAKIQLYGKGSQNKKPIRPLSKARMTRTKKDGSFSVNGLSKGRFYLKIMAPGYGVTVVDTCELDALSTYSENIIKLWPGGVLTGKVLDLTRGYTPINILNSSAQAGPYSNLFLLMAILGLCTIIIFYMSFRGSSISHV